MMDKTASESYFQGAHEALESMNVPHHIKVAAAEYLTKESILGIPSLRYRDLAGGALAALGIGGGGAYLANKYVDNELEKIEKQKMQSDLMGAATAAAVLGTGGYSLYQYLNRDK